MRSDRIAIIFWVLAIVAAAALSAFSQGTPSDLSDLVGARAAGGETQLQNRGYELIKTETIVDSKMGYWWNQSRSACVMVKTTDGRYASIASTAQVNCQRGNDMPSGGGGTTPSELLDLVGARAAGGETQLQNRGYEHIKTETIVDSKMGYWWKGSSSACVMVKTSDGRYASIASTAPVNCQRSNDMPSGGGNSDTPTDLRDLVGARASSGETQLRNRGYEFVKTTTQTDRKFSYWWHESKGVCVSVSTFDGRYNAIMSTMPVDCDRDPNAQADANDETPYDVRDLVGARASSGEAQLKARGYTFIKTEKGPDRSYSNWWDRSNKVCLNVVTIDGRYDTIMSVPPFDCNQTGASSSGNWKLISSTYAERGIRLHSAYILSKFDDIRELKLKALNTPVKVWNMRIYYRNGRTQSVRLPNIISNLRESPAIQLEESGGVRMITFSLNALTILKDKKAYIWIYGK